MHPQVMSGKEVVRMSKIPALGALARERSLDQPRPDLADHGCDQTSKVIWEFG
jgi:hypothetical protein